MRPLRCRSDLRLWVAKQSRSLFVTPSERPNLDPSALLSHDIGAVGRDVVSTSGSPIQVPSPFGWPASRVACLLGLV